MTRLQNLGACGPTRLLKLTHQSRAAGKYVNAIRDCGRCVDSLTGTSPSLSKASFFTAAAASCCVQTR